MYSFFLVKSYIQRKWDSGLQELVWLQEDAIPWRMQDKHWWKWASQSSDCVELLNLVQAVLSPARRKRSDFSETSTASKVQWQVERERSSANSFIKREILAFPTEREGVPCVVTHCQTKSSCTWHGKVCLWAKVNNRIFQMIDLIASWKIFIQSDFLQ